MRKAGGFSFQGASGEAFSRANEALFPYVVLSAFPVKGDWIVSSSPIFLPPPGFYGEKFCPNISESAASFSPPRSTYPGLFFSSFPIKALSVRTK